MRYVGIYEASDKTAGDQGFIFDISMTQHPWRDEKYEWTLIAVIQLPPGASLTTDYHRPDTVDRIHADGGTFGPVDVLNRRLRDIIVWPENYTHTPHEST